GLLGGLIIHTRTELNDVAVRIVERSATVTGVVLLLKERRESSMLSDIPIVVRGLVHRPQGMLAKLAPQASALGLDLARPVYLTQLRHQNLGSGHLVKQLRHRLKAPGVLIDE